MEPSGAEMENIRFGMVCATIMNAVTAIFWDRKKGTPPNYTPSDFFPKDEPKQEQTVEDMAEKLNQIAQAFK